MLGVAAVRAAMPSTVSPRPIKPGAFCTASGSRAAFGELAVAAGRAPRRVGPDRGRLQDQPVRTAASASRIAACCSGRPLP